jgi:hypothetical protein
METGSDTQNEHQHMTHEHDLIPRCAFKAMSEKSSCVMRAALQIRKTAEKLLLSKLKAQVLEEEKAARAVTKGPKPVGKLQHAAITASKQKGKRVSKPSALRPGAGQHITESAVEQQVSSPW